MGRWPKIKKICRFRTTPEELEAKRECLVKEANLVEPPQRDGA
jgi:hypothetical protein